MRPERLTKWSFAKLSGMAVVDPTRPARRRLSPERRRELILDGAMEVFARHGYEAASIQEIAAAGGVTPAVIYDHFASKATLQIELLQRQTALLLEHVATALAGAPAEPQARLRTGVDAFFAFVEQHNFAWRMLVREPPSDPDVARAYRRLEHEATAAIAGFLQAGGAPARGRKGGAGSARGRKGEVARASEMWAQALRAAQNGLAAWWYEHPEVPREEVVDRLMDLCWVGLERVAARRPRSRR